MTGNGRSDVVGRQTHFYGQGDIRHQRFTVTVYEYSYSSLLWGNQHQFLIPNSNSISLAMAQQGSKPYTGPSVSEMIANHTLADNIIKYHNNPDSDAILDRDEFATLLRCVNHPEDRDQILKDAGVTEPTDSTKSQVSLADYIVLRHKDDPVLSEDEMQKLKEWFDSGVSDEILNE